MEARNINRNGVILYRGPSLIDGKPIVVIATGLKRRSKNSKTMDMIQTWILRADINPKDAIYNGEDASISGCRALRGVEAYCASQGPTPDRLHPPMGLAWYRFATAQAVHGVIR